MKIKVLGAGCPNCKQLHQVVTKIAQELVPSAEIEYSTDVAEIIELGVMSVPVLVIDEEIIAVGRIPTPEEIKKAISERMKD